MTDKDTPKPRRFKITFHSQNGDNSDVTICHNYVCNQYMRNVETEINENFLNVLKDAVVYTTVTGDDGKEMKVSIPQHSYTVSPL